MKILVTGANGFVGKNLCVALKNLKEGKDKTRPNLIIEEVFEYDIDSTTEQLEEYCQKADFVFNLAGVNRPENQEEFMQGNFGFVSTLLETLKKYKNTCPVMLSSSVQATLIGRYDSEYGRSKKAGEELFFDYQNQTGAKVLVYRFPNLFGKWCRPNYNSAVATFCNNIANDLPITVNDPTVQLELLYIDDLVLEMLDCLQGVPNRCDYDGLIPVQKQQGRYCFVPTTHKVTLGEIVELLEKFHNQPKTLILPEIAKNSFEKKLYSTYLSYLPKEKIVFDLKMNEDNRGSFTELLKTEKCGQVSVNISKPGITKGEHWHNSKWEFFIVVSGKGVIQQRKIGTDEVLNFEVSGDKIQAVHMLPGYTHNIINLSDTQDLVTVMWANEQFDQNKPDTFYEKVCANANNDFDTVKRVFQNLIASAINPEIAIDFSEYRLSKEQENKLFNLAKKHDLAHLVGYSIDKNNFNLSEESAKRFKSESLIAVMRYEQINYEYLEIVKTFNNEKISFVPLKGSILRGLYAQPWLRTSCDIDILVQEKHLQKAVDALVNINNYKTDNKKDYHDVSLYAPSNVHLELHFNILEKQDNIDQVLKDIWDYVRLLDGSEYEYRQTNEFLVFHLISHLLYHFLGGGCGVRTIIDLWLVHKNLTIDYDTLNHLLKKCNIEKFYQSIMQLARVWFEGESHCEKTIKLENYIFHGGVYGNLENRMKVVGLNEKGKKSYALKRIFAPYELMKIRYPVLKKYKWLLPIYEVVRWFETIFNGKAKNLKREMDMLDNNSSSEKEEFKKFLQDVGL